MADKPETLEETQARLARVQQDAAQPGADPGTPEPPAPTVSVPDAAGAPGTPYGPPPGTRPDPYGDSAPQYTGLADPYAGAAQYVPPAPVGPPKSRAAAVLIGVGVLVMLIIGGVVAYFAFSYSPPDNPFAEPDDPRAEPEYAEEWQNFPGVSYVHPDEVLAQPSYEEVTGQADALISEYRDALTAELGVEWEQQYETYSGLEGNGYGGDSMLYYYDAGTWFGRVQLDDPAARQTAFDLFTDLAAANGGDGVLLRNELYSDDAAMSETEFGAVDLEDQALWSYFDSFPSLAGGYLSVDLMDQNLPVADGFDGDYMFSYEDSYIESTGAIFISISCYSGPLLKEGDRAAFEKALEPYNGDYEP